MPKRVKPATCVGVGVIAFCLVLIPQLRKAYRKEYQHGPDRLTYLGPRNTSQQTLKGLIEGEANIRRRNNSIERSKLSLKGHNPQMTEIMIGSQYRIGGEFNKAFLPRNLYAMSKYVFQSVPRRYLPGFKSSCWYVKKTNLRCLPYFYLLGTPKSGTTDLWEKITKHPDVVYARKEIMQWWTMGRKRDGSPSTFWDNQNWKTWFRNRYQGPQYVTADVMRAIQPDAKLLVILREPVSRLYSGYLYFEDSSRKSPEHFHQEVTMAISKFNSCREKLSYRACAYSPDQVHHGNFARILIGLYAVFTRDWLRAFPREQLKIVRMEDWQINCTGILTDIFSFLTLGNLSPEHTAQICEATPQNSNKAKLREVGDMLPQTISVLKDFYQRSNEELSQLLGSDKFLWKGTYLAQEISHNKRDG
ncbi:carbohydrate sulfotransferase 15-like [Diadema antillarum]|uniref:carbohydrate sulfotransferase 15-like n=1 Tax=Diadema antillarum TaxID=105358 RepID=UPI003A8609E9